MAGGSDDVPALCDASPGVAYLREETEGAENSGDMKSRRGDGERVETFSDDSEVEFPLAEMARLDEMINRARWIVPVLQKGELEVLLDAAVDLCKKGWF